MENRVLLVTGDESANSSFFHYSAMLELNDIRIFITDFALIFKEWFDCFSKCALFNSNLFKTIIMQLENNIDNLFRTDLVLPHDQVPFIELIDPVFGNAS